MSDRISNATKEAVFDAVRHLSPDQVHQLFIELAAATKSLADDYDSKLADVICG